MTTQHALGDSPESELSLSHTSHKLHLFSTLDRLLILRTAQALWTVQPFASESAQANSCRLIRLLGHYPNSTSKQLVYVSVLGVLIVFVAWHPWSLCACFITYDSNWWEGKAWTIQQALHNIVFSKLGRPVRYNTLKHESLDVSYKYWLGDQRWELMKSKFWSVTVVQWYLDRLRAYFQRELL